MPLGDAGVGVGAARPDGDGVLRGVAAEPQVGGGAGVACGAGLARDGLIDGKSALRAGATGLHDGLEDIGHGLGLACGEHLVVLIGVLVERGAGARENLGHGDGVAVLTARGKGGVALAHLDRSEAVAHGAQGERKRRLIHACRIGVDAQVAAHRDDLAVADRLGDLHVASVGRDRRCLRERLDAVVVATVVLHRVAIGDLHGRGAVEQDAGVHTGLDGGSERKALERGAHGAARGGVVDVRVVGVVVAAAHHGLDVAGLGVDHDHAHVELVSAHAGELLGGNLLGRLLNGGVDGGLDGQAALEQDVGGELLLQQALNVVNKVGVGQRAALSHLGDVERKLLGLRGVVLLLRDGAQTQHVVEHLVTARQGAFGVARGV